MELLNGPENALKATCCVNHKVDGMDVLVKIIVHADADIVYENPFKEFVLDDWHIGVAEEIMSIANAALYDKEPEYGVEGRKDVEMCSLRSAVYFVNRHVSI